jgi:tetratricopeptide (TPR) repeat protein
MMIDCSSPEALCAAGNSLGEQGRLDEAIACYRRAIGLHPGFAPAHNSLGHALRVLGRLGEAEACYREAIRLRPGSAGSHFNLGRVLDEAGRGDEAIACYRQAVRLRPEFVEAHRHLGTLLAARGALREAAASLAQAVQLRPDAPAVHNNLGNVLRAQGQRDQAIGRYREAIRLRPDCAEAHNNLGNVLREEGRLDEAIACYRRARELRPGSVDVLTNLAAALANQGEFAAAEESARRAIALAPGCAEAHGSLGAALRCLGRLEAAEAAYREAIRLRPDCAEAHGNLGAVLADQGQEEKLAEACAEFEAALRLAPENHAARKRLAQTLLALGDFARGWAEYEARLKLPGHTGSTFCEPRWEGEPLKGRTILLHAEQGLGDTLQFVRYAPLVQARGGRVVVECPGPLRRLLAGCAGIDRVVPQGAALPAFDLHAPLMSLPKVFGTTLANVPARVPYIVPDAGLAACWARALAGLDGLKVGIAWQGNPQYRRDRVRSIPLVHFEPLARIAEIRLISLQKGFGTEQLAALDGRFPVLDLGGQLDEQHGGFMDTAAIMASLDLVITSDTAVPHLAGALGVPVWLALPYAPDWRWLLDRQDSPWYPTMRLFRQGEPGDWRSVFAAMAEALEARPFPFRQATPRVDGKLLPANGSQVRI